MAGSSALSNPPESKDVEGNQDGKASQQWECVCYGLGSFSSSISARYQLAMLLLLLDAKQVRGYVDNQINYVYHPFIWCNSCFSFISCRYHSRTALFMTQFSHLERSML